MPEIALMVNLSLIHVMYKVVLLGAVGEVDSRSFLGVL